MHRIDVPLGGSGTLLVHQLAGVEDCIIPIGTFECNTFLTGDIGHGECLEYDGSTIEDFGFRVEADGQVCAAASSTPDELTDLVREVLEDATSDL